MKEVLCGLAAISLFVGAYVALIKVLISRENRLHKIRMAAIKEEFRKEREAAINRFNDNVSAFMKSEGEAK